VRRVEAEVLAVALVLGCSSVRPAKRPDESRRVPVNRTLPGELRGKEADPARQGSPDPREVEWR